MLISALSAWGGGALCAQEGAGGPSCLQLLSSEEGFYEFKITPPQPDWGEAGSRRDGLWEGDLRVEGFQLLEIPGHPALPYRVWRIAVPEGSTYRYEIVSLHYREFRNRRPRPVPSLRHTEQDTLESVYEEDPAVYQSDAFYPESPVLIRRGGVFRGIHFVSLEVAPVLMHLREGRVRYYDRLVVHLYVEGAETEPAEEPDPFFREAPRHFLNPEQARRYKAGRARREPTALPSEPFGFPGGPGLPSGPLPTSGEPETEGDSYKLTVTQNGVYRLDHAYLTANAPELPWPAVDPRYFRLYNKGQEIPIYVYDAGTVGLFESGEYLELYAEGHFDENLTDLWDEGDYTDKNVYWLQLDSATLGARVATRDGSPVNGYTAPAYFQSTPHYEEDIYFVNGPPYDPAVLHPPRWYWEITRYAAPGPLYTFPITIPSAAGGTATFDFKIQGATLPADYRVIVRLNGTQIADEAWTGRNFHTFTASTSQVLPESSTLEMEVMDPTPTTGFMHFHEFDLTYSRDFEAYQDELAFDYGTGDHRFAISEFASSDVTIYDISDKTAPIRIVNADISGLGPWTATFEDTIPAATSYSYFAASVYRTPDSIVKNTPSDLKNILNGADWIAITPDEFYNDVNLDDLIAHRALQCADIDCTNGIDDDGDGLTDELMRTMKVRVEDIYDEFSFGIFTPYAVRDFVFYAYHNWTPPSPAYILLVGEATFDYKNNLDMPTIYEHAPTPMFDSSDWAGSYAGDVWYAMVDPPDPGDPEKPDPDDVYPDLHVGRFSVRDASDLAVYIDRLLNPVDGYETAPLSGAWQGNAVMVSDNINDPSCTPVTCTGGGGDPPECIFERAHDDSALFIADNEPAATVQQIYFDKDPYFGCNSDKDSCPACTTSGITTDIQSAINGGALLVSYIGHGAWRLWSGENILYVDDLDALTNGGMAPWVINANCYTGGIQGPANYSKDPDSQECLTEKFLRDIVPPLVDGAVAAYSPSAIGFTDDIYGPVTTIFQSIFGRDKDRNLGTLTMNHRMVFLLPFEATEMMKFILLGDPVTDLVLPVPAPSPDLRVQSVGHGSVTLEWDPSPDETNPNPDLTVTGYYVWRSETGNENSFTRITATPVPAVLGLVVYTDGTPGCAGNANDYYYYVTPVNADGFQGPSTPPSPGSVMATPLNPNPPAPPDMTAVQDLETGMRLKVLWNANTECDFQNYTIHYDTDSGAPYANSITLWDITITEYVVGNLTDGKSYCFAMTATNTSSKTSDYSVELCATPTHTKGYAPPAMITDLKVELSNPGGKPLLKWTAPTTDIYGDSPIALDRFAIYRREDGNPDFVPDRSSASPDRIVDNILYTGPGVYTYEDITADTTAGAAYDGFYYVTAYDANSPVGESSVSRPHPQGVSGVMVEPFFGWYYVSWTAPAPLLDIEGNLTDTAQYHVYGETAAPDFQPDRYFHTNWLYSTTLPQAFCCPVGDGCDFEHPTCVSLTFKVVIEDVKGNEGLH
ncbi:MAG: hypothetical protein JSV08_09155 [Acidobacteriota bacterium]|nr:MAG: hypothetical protein JSV08_09155 [Acidobacteriota bacterium]